MLREMRIAAGLSQAELARISGVNYRSLQDYEQGHKSLASAKGETILRISSALGCSMNDLMDIECQSFDMRLPDRIKSASIKSASIESAGIESASIEATRTTEYQRMLAAGRFAAYQAAIEKRKADRVHFPIIEPDELIDMSRIYPTKQRMVKSVVDELRQEKRVSALILFGSSITMACHKDSDLDFAVKLNDLTSQARNEVSEKLQMACNWGVDILWMDHLEPGERVYEDIRKGLVLI